MNFFTGIASNQTLVVPVSAMIAVQVYKFARDRWRTRNPSLHILFGTGGMPSSHSALVTSLATATGIQYGFESAYFAISCVMALIVMYDARAACGKKVGNTPVLNQIVRERMSGHAISDRELKEFLGHTTTEVFVGGLVGILFTLLFI